MLTSFHVFIGHMHVFFGGMSVYIFCLFFDWTVLEKLKSIHDQIYQPGQ